MTILKQRSVGFLSRKELHLNFSFDFLLFLFHQIVFSGPQVPMANQGPMSRNIPNNPPSSLPHSSSGGQYIPPANNYANTDTGPPRMPTSNFPDPSRTQPLSRYPTPQSMPGSGNSAAHHEMAPPNSVARPQPSQITSRGFQNVAMQSTTHPGSIHGPGPQSMPMQNSVHGAASSQNSVSGPPAMPPSSRQHVPNAMSGPPSIAQSNSLHSNSMLGSQGMNPQQGLPGVIQPNSMQGNAPTSSISGPPNMHQPNQMQNPLPSQRMMQGQPTSMNANSFNPGMRMSSPQMMPSSSNVAQPHSMNHPPGPMSGPPMTGGLPMGGQPHYPQHADHQQIQNRQPGYGGLPPQPQPARRLDPDQMPSPVSISSNILNRN